MLGKVDNIIKRLMNGLLRHKLDHCVNLIILADHGKLIQFYDLNENKYEFKAIRTDNLKQPAIKLVFLLKGKSR